MLPAGPEADEESEREESGGHCQDRGTRSAQYDRHTRENAGGKRQDPLETSLDASQGQSAEQRDCQPPSEIVGVSQRAGRPHDDRFTCFGVVGRSGLQRVDIEVLKNAVNRRDDSRDRESAQHVPQ